MGRFSSLFRHTVMKHEENGYMYFGLSDKIFSHCGRTPTTLKFKVLVLLFALFIYYKVDFNAF